MGQTIKQTCRVKLMRYKLTGISWVWKRKSGWDLYLVLSSSMLSDTSLPCLPACPMGLRCGVFSPGWGTSQKALGFAAINTFIQPVILN